VFLCVCVLNMTCFYYKLQLERRSEDYRNRHKVSLEALYGVAKTLTGDVYSYSLVYGFFGSVDQRMFKINLFDSCF
jgi:hypothetical protein